MTLLIQIFEAMSGIVDFRYKCKVSINETMEMKRMCRGRKEKRTETQKTNVYVKKDNYAVICLKID